MEKNRIIKVATRVILSEETDFRSPILYGRTGTCPAAAVDVVDGGEDGVPVFQCSIQTGATDYLSVPCHTYCLVAYYKNSAIPDLLTSDPVCMPARP